MYPPSANAGRTVRCDLRHRGYEKILHTETATWDEQGSVQLSYDLSVLAEGDYVVTVSVEDHEQYPFDVAMRKLPFKRGAVQYTDHGVLLRDGNRIFPIGYFYVKNQLRSDLDFRQEYAKAGFTSYILGWMGPAGYIEKNSYNVAVYIAILFLWHRRSFFLTKCRQTVLRAP
mgnify:CR=1 FL=1